MRLMPHQVLQKLSENSRNRAQHELTALSRQRQKLIQHIEETESHMKELGKQREQTLKVGAQASLLVMFNEIIVEQREQMGQLEASLEQLHLQEQVLLDRWLEHDHQSKVFGKMDTRLRAGEQRSLERRRQRLDDDRAASIVAAGI